MTIVLSVIGIVLAIIGVSLFRKQKKALGSVLVIVGVALLILGFIAISSFHP